MFACGAERLRGAGRCGPARRSGAAPAALPAPSAEPGRAIWGAAACGWQGCAQGAHGKGTPHRMGFQGSLSPGRAPIGVRACSGGGGGEGQGTWSPARTSLSRGSVCPSVRVRSGATGKGLGWPGRGPALPSFSVLCPGMSQESRPSRRQAQRAQHSGGTRKRGDSPSGGRLSPCPASPRGRTHESAPHLVPGPRLQVTHSLRLPV